MSESEIVMPLSPANGWLFTALSVAPSYSKMLETGTDNVPLILIETETTSLGTQTLEQGVREAARRRRKERFVWVDPFPSRTIVATHQDMLDEIKVGLDRKIDKAVAAGKGLAVGFSVWSHQTLFDVMDLSVYLRERSAGQALCFIGGPYFMAYEKKKVDAAFAAGVDVITIGYGQETMQWIGSFKHGDPIGRDHAGNLIAPLPDKSPFFTINSPYQSGVRGSKMPVSTFFRRKKEQIQIFLPNNGCVNGCWFCAVDEKDGTPIRYQSGQELTAHVNRLLATSPSTRREWLGPKTAVIEICNPNPQQNASALNRFVEGLDVSRSILLSAYGDLQAFRTRTAMERHFDFLDRHLSRHPLLNMFMVLSMDAVQAKNDGDFLGRSVFSRLLREDEYEAIRAHYSLFLDRVAQSPWRDQLSLQLNMISHPGMTPDIYARKDAIYHQLSAAMPEANRSLVYGGLIPFDGTRVAKEYDGFYASLYEMEKGWKLGYAPSSFALSLWGNQFRQGDLFDCALICDAFAEANQLIYPSLLFEVLYKAWDDPAAPVQTSFRCSEKSAAFLHESAQSILLEEGPRALSLLSHFLDLMMNGSRKAPALIGNPIEATIGNVRLFNAVTDWIHRREIDIARQNPVYAQNKMVPYLIEATHALLQSTAPAQKEIDRMVPPVKRTPGWARGHLFGTPLQR